MKTLSIVTIAILLGLGGVAMANDSGENHQDNTNTGGFNPYMPELSTPSARGYAQHGYAAFAQHPVEHPLVKHHVKR